MGKQNARDNRIDCESGRCNRSLFCAKKVGERVCEKSGNNLVKWDVLCYDKQVVTNL